MDGLLTVVFQPRLVDGRVAGQVLRIFYLSCPLIIFVVHGSPAVYFMYATRSRPCLREPARIDYPTGLLKGFVESFANPLRPLAICIAALVGQCQLLFCSMMCPSRFATTCPFAWHWHNCHLYLVILFSIAWRQQRCQAKYKYLQFYIDLRIAPFTRGYIPCRSVLSSFLSQL